MALTKEQIEELRKQLSQQVEHLPEDQKSHAQEQINSMSPEALEEMLKQQQPSQQIFRAIVSGEISSRKIAENSSAVAVLDIKPISKGHTVIISKEQITSTNDLPEQAFSLAKQVSQKLTKKLKSKDTNIIPQVAFGEAIINVIPIYNTPIDINSPRTQPSEEELDKIYMLLKEKKKIEKIKIKKPKNNKPIKLKRKIP
jgi:diadenosine tetraphosphate (Ap4A) HIT family hydrolase